MKNLDKIETFDLRLFEPKGKHLAEQYVELKGYKEFEDLPESELLFCWYYGNPTSPFFEIINKDGFVDEQKKLKACFEEALTASRVPKKEKDLMLKGDFPPRIKNGIAVMKSFKPLERFKSYLTTKHIINNLQKIAYVDKSDLSDMDVDEAKKYVSTAIMIVEKMPAMVRQLEYGYALQATEISTQTEIKVSMRDIN